jgi:uncharacterized protein with von Willebrand factor type A (vWA) domain
MRNVNKKSKYLSDDLRISEHIIENDSYDLLVFDEIKENTPKIKKTETDGVKDYSQFKELHQDLFDALFKYDPKKVPPSQVAYTHLLNSEIMDAILESPQYKELRNLTRLDAIAATVGTEIMGDEVRALIKELKEKFEKLLEQMQPAAQAVEEAKQAAGEGEDGEEFAKSGKGKSAEEITYEEAKKRLEEYKQQVHELVDKKERRALNKIVENAINQSREVSDMISNWGLEASDSFVRSNYQDKLKLLERLRTSHKLKKIAELAGRYKRMAIQTQREKVKKGMDEVYDIIPGRDLSRVLASEKMKLLHPLTARLFKKDLLEGKVLQYETSGREKKHKGPVVICVDDSGSMSGQNEIWAKSVAMGVLEICRIQKRDVHVIHFDASPKHQLHCNFFPKNNYQIEEIIDMAEYFSGGGGTLFEPPLELAQDKINTMKEFSKADILFITDGESAISNSWLKPFMVWKKEKNITITSILIDTYANSDSCVKTFSDNIEKLWNIRRDNSDDLALTLFSNI